MSQGMNLTDILEEIHKNANGEDLTVGKVVEALEHRGFGPLLLAAALLTILPTGGIPGVPTVTGILVFLIAIQLIIGKGAPWIPSRLAGRSIKKEKFEEVRKKAEPYTRKIDKIIKPRLTSLTGPNGSRIVAGICALLALTMPPLEIFPFAAFVPAFAIGLLAIGLSAKDGLFLVAAGIVLMIGLGAGATSYF